MKVFVQENIKGQELPHFYGVRDAMVLRGHEVIPFKHEDVVGLSFDEDCIVYGGVTTVEKALSAMGMEIPITPTIPEQWHDFAGRDYKYTTLGECNGKVNRMEFDFFVKPAETHHKVFNGVAVRRYSDSLKFMSIPSETPVFVSDLLDIVTEYRCLFCFGDLNYGTHYSGDFTKYPDWDKIKAHAKKNYFRDIYVLDFGLTAEGETILIEANDIIACGYYGCPPHLFCELLEKRWEELRK